MLRALREGAPRPALLLVLDCCFSGGMGAKAYNEHAPCLASDGGILLENISMERLFSLFVGAEQLKNAGIRCCIFEIANLFTLESFKAPESSRGTRVEHAKGDSGEQVKSGGRGDPLSCGQAAQSCFGGLNAMKSASRQFGMRESPASKRRHDSRLADQSEIAPYSLAPENADESTFSQSTQSVQRAWPEFRDAAHSAATGEGGCHCTPQRSSGSTIPCCIWIYSIRLGVAAQNSIHQDWQSTSLRSVRPLRIRYRQQTCLLATTFQWASTPVLLQ